MLNIRKKLLEIAGEINQCKGTKTPDELTEDKQYYSENDNNIGNIRTFNEGYRTSSNLAVKMLLDLVEEMDKENGQ